MSRFSTVEEVEIRLQRESKWEGNTGIKPLRFRYCRMESYDDNRIAKDSRQSCC